MMFDVGGSDMFGNDAYCTRDPFCRKSRQRSYRRIGLRSGSLGRLLDACTSPCDKRYQRRALLGILYTLVGVSLISTLSFWTAVRGSFTRDVRDSEYCQSKNICPELEIPGLVKMRAVDLEDRTMNMTVVEVTGSQHHHAVHRAVETGHTIMLGLVNEARRYNTSVRKPIMDSLAPLAMGIEDYMYIPGGYWKPTSCLPRWKVAIIFPYRDRPHHLPIVLRYLTPMLRRQRLEFAFFTINQANSLKFNRALLMNIGFVETLNFSKWDCFIFHDVDHIPLSDFNYYGCSGMPRHFLSGSNRWKYNLPYKNFFGAVTGFTTSNLHQINGFPNVYWGWGGEDDEIWARVREVGLPISRARGRNGYYDVINHHHNSAPQFKQRLKLLQSFRTRHRLDGLSNLHYNEPKYEIHALYTNISVDIHKIRIIVPAPHPPAVPVMSQGDRETEFAQKSTLLNDRRVAAARAALAKGHVKTKSRSEVKQEPMSGQDHPKSLNESNT